MFEIIALPSRNATSVPTMIFIKIFLIFAELANLISRCQSHPTRASLLRDRPGAERKLASCSSTWRKSKQMSGLAGLGGWA